ncbi:response regulator transcription factor [Xylocopilactobacillus apicola]|uniref:DNA-binding response regulator n=1 Tax=Xylocopilactobacillus apicola TaxID=2932184 RepID=A0AAU9DXL1_9LACO|nr:response regulator transcription factor [Xylocopilactobacillus apicola]BDR58863.1 DNA-binding response regulator [Xylocopilactobacillus apicola]
MRVLIIEDEEAIAEAVAEVLKRNNYLVDVANDGESGRDFAMSNIYDLIILDLMLPKIDGFEILGEIRKSELAVPVVCLTAKSQIEDKIHGLDCGADDYLTKPFHMDELLARIRAVKRRSTNLQTSELLNFVDLKLNVSTFELHCRKGSVILTPKEARILEVMIHQGPIASSKELLIQKIWGYDSEAVDNNVEIQISFLRKKLVSLNTLVEIRTIRSVGYILAKKNA